MFSGPSSVNLPRQLRRLASIAITTIATLGFAGHALATCYSAKEAAAEQAIRLHSELMVVGLTCAAQFNDPALFVRYAKFTNQHRADIVAHEEAMIGYFAKHAEGNAKRRFDHWRTSIANAVSTRAAYSSAEIYCSNKGEMLEALEGAPQFNSKPLKAILTTAPEAAVTSRPLCTQEAVASSTAE